MAPGPEKRRTDRVPVDVTVQFTLKGSLEKNSGVAKDISLGGMFVETESPAPFRASILVGLTLPSQQAPVLLSGTVRWTSARGMGIQFGLLGARETYAITELQRAHVSLAIPAARDAAARIVVHEPRMSAESRRAAVERAHRLQAQGRQITEIAETLGVSPAVVQVWLAERRP